MELDTARPEATPGASLSLSLFALKDLSLDDQNQQRPRLPLWHGGAFATAWLVYLNLIIWLTLSNGTQAVSGSLTLTLSLQVFNQQQPKLSRGAARGRRLF
jgi:hypothetical protein